MGTQVQARKPDAVDAELMRLSALRTVRGARKALEEYRRHSAGKVHRLQVEVEKAEEALERAGVVS